MPFDSSRAWRDASAILRSGRSVLSPIAGVFLLLPVLVGSYFFADVQVAMAKAMGNEALMRRLFAEHGAVILGYSLASFVLQAVGWLAMLAIMTDRERPTVAEALVRGLRLLPRALAMLLVVFSGLVFASLLVGTLAIPLAAVAGGAAQDVAAVVLIALFLAAIVRLSVALPVAVKHGRVPAVAALVRSYRLTAGNSLRLLGFYVLLVVAYLVILLVASVVVLGPAVALLGQGDAGMLAGAMVSGLVGTAASVVFCAVLAAVCRQLEAGAAGGPE